MKHAFLGCAAASLLALAACSKQTPDTTTNVTAPPPTIAMPASSVVPTGPAFDPSLPPASVVASAPATSMAPSDTPSAPAGMASAASAAMAPASGASMP